MKILFDHIPEGVSDLELTFEAAEIGLELEDVRFNSPVTARLRLFKQLDKVFVKAQLSVAVEIECARCLDPVQMILEGSSENQYRPLPKIPTHIMDEIGIEYYSGEHIDLSDDFRESLLLEMPAKVLCIEDCRGLCPRCGCNLNEEQCNCHLESEKYEVSRFAELVRMLEINSSNF